MRRLLLMPLLAACGGPTETTWLQAAGFEWDIANHRLSQLTLRPSDAGFDVALIGGASTTGVVFDDDDSCIGEGCREFPFLDDSAVFVRESRATSDRVVLGAGSVDVRVAEAGASAEVVVTLPRRARGEVVALIRGLSVDTGVPLEGAASCYDPRHGWLPRRLSIQLGTPVVSGAEVSVPVQVAFTAGETFEEERVCLDAVYRDAQVDLTVDVAVLAGVTDVVTHTITTQAAFDCEACPGTAVPPPQPAPTGEAIAVQGGLSGAVVGWSSLDYRFHQDDPDGPRGAYIRSLLFDADPDEATALGFATNQSPVTQLSGFDVAFEGTLVEAGGDLTVTTAIYEVVDLPAELDEAGVAVITTLAAE